MGCRKRWLLLLLLAPIALIVGCQAMIGAHDQLHMYRLATELSSYPLPQATEVLARDTSFGYPLNSDWCSAVARMEIRTRLSAVEVERFYRQFEHSAIEDGPMPFVMRPFIEHLDSDGSHNRFRITITRLVICVIS